MVIGIDLLWVRPNICGGTESVIRNLLNGFGSYDKKNEYILFAGKDTADTFKHYEEYPNMQIHVCNTESMKRVKRIAWENANLDKEAGKLNVDIMLIPVYSKPKSKSVEKGGIPYVTVIHDLQALHFPEYFSKAKILFAKRSWKKACVESERIITISEYCKEDIIKNYPFVKDKIEVIYDPIVTSEKIAVTDHIDTSDQKVSNDRIDISKQTAATDQIDTSKQTAANDPSVTSKEIMEPSFEYTDIDSREEVRYPKSEEISFSGIEKKYNITKNKYFYTVSSMLPHKNLVTLIKTMKALKGSGDKVLKDITLGDIDLTDIKLVVSGVGGNKEDFDQSVKDADVEDMIIDTGFVSNEERDSLYANCLLFLFPSTFEGFGMPPIEAMMKGARVVTTGCACLEEVTKGLATYVSAPTDEEEWIVKIKEALSKEARVIIFKEYELENITGKYLEVFNALKTR